MQPHNAKAMLPWKAAAPGWHAGCFPILPNAGMVPRPERDASMDGVNKRALACSLPGGNEQRAPA